MGTNLETSRRNSLQMELRTWQGNMAIDAIPWEVMTSRRWKHVHVEVIWWLMPSLSHSNYVQCEWMNEWSTNSVNQHYDMTLYQSQSVLLHYTYVKKRRVCLCVCVCVSVCLWQPCLFRKQTQKLEILIVLSGWLWELMGQIYSKCVHGMGSYPPVNEVKRSFLCVRLLGLQK